MLPTLAPLSINTHPTHDAWYRACGARPDFEPWKNVSGEQKYSLLHGIALKAEGEYLSAYQQVDIDSIMRDGLYSVEHVVPRSHVNGRLPGKAENDPIGWIVATRRSNSARSNSPLVLWLTGDSEYATNTTVRIDGVQHYVPPIEQRARLARKWLFIRATYGTIDEPSAAQMRHAEDILELARGKPLESELSVNQEYRKLLNWANPILEEGGSSWFEDEAWVARVFGRHAKKPVLW